MIVKSLQIRVFIVEMIIERVLEMYYESSDETIGFKNYGITGTSVCDGNEMMIKSIGF